MKRKEKVSENTPAKEPRAEKEKKPKSEEYVLKKNSMMKVMRIAFWVMLGFVFIRGVFTIFTPDRGDQVEQMIRDFRATLSQEKELNNEAMAFAQNFAKEYLTYTAKDEAGHKERLKPYVSTRFYNQTGLVDYKNSAEAVYVQAYRLEEYSGSQLDVYVLAEVKYTSSVISADQSTYESKVEVSQTVLKVPLYVSGGQYVVESIPMFVSDSVGIGDYAVNDYHGTALKEAQAQEVQTAITNFLKAYYEQDETVIDYYLSDKADKAEFAGLNGRYTFRKISTMSSYQEPGEDIICLVEYTIVDEVNGAVLTQKIHLSVTKGGSRYYINSMNTRTGNIHF